MGQRTRVWQMIKSSRGQTMAEYALILATIAVISVALVGNAGTIVNSLLNNVDSLF